MFYLNLYLQNSIADNMKYHLLFALIILLGLSMGGYSNTPYLIVALDYQLKENCSPICFGLADFVKDFEYDISAGIIKINTYQNFNCSQDGVFRDRFQHVVKVELNGDQVGTLKHAEYDIANGVIWVTTNELNFNCLNN